MTDADHEGDPQDSRRGAAFGSDRTYRYRLWRTWDEDAPTLAFIMLNPSTADAHRDDPTVRRCVDYAKRWGYGRLLVGNLFALRATDPDRLAIHEDPVGPANDDHLRAIAAEADDVVVAWGHRGDYRNRGREVTALLDVELLALGTTANGQPCHPLYKPGDLRPVRWP